MELNYKRLSESEGELTLCFSDYKELLRFLQMTRLRSFYLVYRDENLKTENTIGVYHRHDGIWYDRRYRCIVSLDAELRRIFKKYGTLYLTQKNTNHYLLDIIKSLKQMEVA